MSLFKNISGQHPPPPTSPPTLFLYLSFRQFDKSSEEFVLCQMLAFGINNERAGPIIGYSRASSCLSSNWDYDFSIVAQHSSKFVTIVLVEGVI